MSANYDYPKEPVNSTIHQTFAAISANQEFALDDVITELKALHDHNAQKFKEYFNALNDGVEKGQLVKYDKYVAQDLENLVKCHNARIVAETMKKNGEQTITLNPKKELMDQVLTNAHRLNFDTGSLLSMGFSYQQLRLAC